MKQPSQEPCFYSPMLMMPPSTATIGGFRITTRVRTLAKAKWDRDTPLTGNTRWHCQK